MAPQEVTTGRTDANGEGREPPTGEGSIPFTRLDRFATALRGLVFDALVRRFEIAGDAQAEATTEIVDLAVSLLRVQARTRSLSEPVESPLSRFFRCTATPAIPMHVRHDEDGVRCRYMNAPTVVMLARTGAVVSVTTTPPGQYGDAILAFADGSEWFVCVRDLPPELRP